MTSQPTAERSESRTRRPLVGRQVLHGPAWFAVLAPPLVPVVLWLSSDAVSVAFAAPAGALRSAALLAGLCGYSAFATNLVLSARWPAVERLFGGLDRMYRFHRRLAAAVAALLVAHVALVVGSQAATPGASVAGLLLPDAGWRVFAGVLAFAGFAAILTVTLLGRLRHEPFLRVHRVFGLVFAVGALHALRVQGIGSQIRFLDGYLLVLTAAAIAGWIYRSGLGRTLVRRNFYQVASLRPRGASIAEVALEPADAPLDFEPGQHVFIGINHPAVGRELHPFSITSAPGEPTLRLAVKAVGDYTSALPGVEPGAWVRVEGPYGGFWHRGEQVRRQLWIAGGIGITPFLSMVRSLPFGQSSDDGQTSGDGGLGKDRKIDLYYLTDKAAAAVFLDELLALAADRPGLRVIPHADEDSGFLTAARVVETSGDLTGAAVYLCGPKPMTDALTTQLVNVGVPRHRVHFEEFRLGGPLR
ncbi:MAG: ferric reductase-like transmembrane domain-containing protein [Actinomycetota bacterium]|jgi:predicted ferric reductase|nr:ferric reductase-like transmembrane domain-containing protein [Euzebyaceae bacterium]MDQ3453402.1 ferric reductase-like transmembrane domain-containing protein [Actinomycetota bacterium]